jgi:hypothetical protein
MRFLVLGIAALLACALPTAAQEHEHAAGGGVLLLTDGPAYVGSPVRFTAIVLGDDELPDVHQNMHLKLMLDGKTMFETTPASGHDYDGINSFDFVFPAPGNYSFQALGDDVLAQLRGAVHHEQGLLQLEAENDAGTLPQSGLAYVHQLHGAGYSSVRLETHQDGRLAFRTVTTKLDSWRYAYPDAGGAITHIAAACACTRSAGAQFGADVLPGPPVGDGAVAVAAPQTALNPVVRGSSDAPYAIIGTYDPYTVIGPDTVQHLGVLVIDPATKMPIPDVAVHATLLRQGATLFDADLHTRSGFLEVAARYPTPGNYVFTATASTDNWTGQVQLPYTVAPPSAATAIGVPRFRLEADLVGGTPGNVSLHAVDARGMPYAHSEVELEIIGAGTVLAAKLHTHGDGKFPFTVTLPAGTYALRITPFSLLPEATLPDGLLMELHVADPATTSTTTTSHTTIPAPWALAVLALPLAALARRRP